MPQQPEPAAISVPDEWDEPIQRSPVASLRFTAYSWAKYHYLRDLTSNEVTCFGITDEDDPLLVKDLWVPKQEVSVATTELDDESFAIAVEEMGKMAPPSTFTRIWLHTHPGSSATPSSTDRTTQSTTFSTCEWHVMGILAQGGQTHCEMSWWGPDRKSLLSARIPMEVAWHEPFDAADPDHWSAEYAENVTARTVTYTRNDSMRWLPPNQPLTSDQDRKQLLEFAQKEPALDFDDPRTLTDGYCYDDALGWTHL